MSKIGIKKWLFGAYLTILMALSSLGTFAFMQNMSNSSPSTSANSTSTLTSAQISPFIKEYLNNLNALNEDGTINIPTVANTSSVTTVEDAIQKLLSEGQLNYLKGDRGERGASGATGADGQSGTAGATGPAGPAGSSSLTSVGSGLNLSGGTLTLSSCALDQVLMVDGGSNWTCATVSATGVDTNTTNSTATLHLSNATLHHVITDTDGNTITSNSLDLGDTFATDAEVTSAISDFTTSTEVTNTIDALNLSQYATNTAVANAITTLNLSQYATTADLTSLTSRITTLETNATNYITSTELTTTLSTYATEQWVTDQNYLVASNLNGYVLTSTLTTTLGNYYTKNQIDGMNFLRGAAQGYTVQVVTTLPATKDPNVIYLVGP